MNLLLCRVAYNEREATANEAAAMQAEVQSTASDTVQISEVSTAYTSKAVDMAKDLNDSTQPIGEHHDKTEFWWELLGRVLIPTDTSLSAVGSIFYYKNLTGQVLVTISFLLTIMLVLHIFRNKALTYYTLMLKIGCLLGFVIVSFVSEISLRWRVWLLVILLFLQLGIMIHDRRKAYR